HSLAGALEMPNDKTNMNEPDSTHTNAASVCEPIDSTPFFSLQVKKHDDEKEKHHYGAGVNQHLNDSDKEGVKRHEKSSQPNERAQPRCFVRWVGCSFHVA